jgi:hypothetical protein
MSDTGEMHSTAFRRCLLEVDVAGMRRLWAHVAPHLPQMATDAETLHAIHRARTQAESMPLRARAWSHRWLLDHGHESGLPDHLKPNAERIYPRIAEAVGLSVNFTAPFLRPVADEVRGAMETVVLDEYNGAVVNVERLKRGMQAAREKTMRQLVGRLSAPR